jgi:hypothetical protein
VYMIFIWNVERKQYYVQYTSTVTFQNVANFKADNKRKTGINYSRYFVSLYDQKQFTAGPSGLAV